MNEDTLAVIGRAPESRREALVRLMWIVIWLAFMGAPASDLLQDEHTAWATARGGLGLASFVGCYLFVIFRHISKPLARATVCGLLAGLLALATLLSLSLGSEWLLLFVYAAVASGAALPLPMARWAIEGANPLTDREREVLRAASDGSTNAELATALHLSQGTVRNYLSTAIQKLASRNRAEAVRVVRDKGWL
ncbi:response regulator transcription factor [Streptomyces sp. A5-4]|uniref:helix-turn-helix transcriptional regulator n=1 Tax=Streptomyces sp. A5-4 TaxID=3384771 RepID=UPI003DA7FC53